MTIDVLAAPKVIELKLSTGVDLTVTPVTAFDLQALRDRARKLYPAPDPKQYEQAVPEADALVPGQKISGDQHPAYIEAMEAVERQRGDFLNAGILHLSLEFKEPKADIIARYRPVLDRKREVIDLPADEWRATLLHGVLESQDDLMTVLAAAQDKLPLEGGEMIGAVRLFRPIGQRRAHRGVPQRQEKARHGSADQKGQPDQGRGAVQPDDGDAVVAVQPANVGADPA